VVQASVSSFQSAEASLPYPDALSPSFLHILGDSLNLRTDIDEKKESSCQKLLFSATLTRDPSKIAALDLRDPKYFVIRAQETEGGMAIEKFARLTDCRNI
jgi:ATP-dependent RNA helicase DDX51/DBP6